MLLATKCPHCKTTFKVANDQLKLQSGLVRCGICHQVFNGIEHLAPSDAAVSTVKINPPSATPAEPPADIIPVTADAPALPSVPEPREFDLFDTLGIKTDAPPQEQRIEPVLEAPPPQLADTFFPPLSDEFAKPQSTAEFEKKIQALLDADLQSEATALPAADQAFEEIILTPPEELTFSGFESESFPPPKAVEVHSEPRDDEHEDDAEEVDDDDDDDLALVTADEDLAQLLFIRQAQSRKRLKWIISAGTLLLALLLIGQLTFQFRNVLAVAYPASKDSLVLMCRMLQCQIKLPAMLDAISYEADELHNLPHENTFEFSLLMRNRSALTQAWPAIELTLKDNKKQVVLRQVFNPSSYLSSAADALSGFQPNSEQPVKLYFVVDKVKATDYTVSIFYP